MTKFEIAKANTRWTFDLIRKEKAKATRKGDTQMLRLLAKVEKEKLDSASKNERMVNLWR